MDLIIGIMLYMGVIAPGETPTETQIETYESDIEYYSSDPAFLDYYESEMKADDGGHIVIIDIMEGD